MTGTERKTFQKYYPPDFDPKKLKKERGRKRSNQFVQRVMAPFNMQCNTCHEYIYKGKKFNMRRETAEGESYLGLKIFRFYFRCPNCLADISFKTDIENVDYTAEHGATRLFEAHKFYMEQAKEKEAKEEAEKNDAMKMLEKRIKMSKAEMEAAGRLEELQELSRKNQSTDPLEYLIELDKKLQLSRAELIKFQEEEDEREIAELMGLKKAASTIKTEDDDYESVDDEEEMPSDDDNGPSTSTSSTTTNSLYSSIRKRAVKEPMSLLSGMIVKKNKFLTADPVPTTKPVIASASTAVKPSSSTNLSMAARPPLSSATTRPPASLAGLADYGSTSEDES